MSFIDDNFLLETDYAAELYHDHAKDMPIIDYHNHLPPEQITNHHKFKNLTQAWLAGDHYKWRAMRTLGIDEQYITGNATDEEKFLKWAGAVPYTIRNPLYHWTHLELQRYFGIKGMLSDTNAAQVYENASGQLQQKSHSAKGLLNQMNVEVVCTTDDPSDTLEHHISAQKNNMVPKLLPTFRPDRAYAIEDGGSYQTYTEKLGNAAGMQIATYQDLLMALKRRIAHFHKIGCRLSDHGLEQLYFFELGIFDIESIFKKVLSGKVISIEEIKYFKFETLLHLCKEYHKKGWVQQFHLGALRNVNQRMHFKLGPDTGFDSIGDFRQALPLGSFLNLLDSTDQLPKTILYNLNPSQNEVFATMVGNFNDGSIKGKIQFGSGWWYMDQLDGMERQLNTLSNMGLFSCFVGMLTDSRSFLSFSRHEYFRRLLCNMLGNDIKKGLLPKDMVHIGKIVRDISYYNAKAYFKF
ncbi:Glucuronate isomerase [Flagellimonas maritima]|uniref:Uronate isomerase n=1 Tax=Flagellimonas maritima TaxID=1383885 RepID=A0A2Z4LPH2_9FLAO|nr:glucuronate isomerase [Allomuricauda aurantiaca]AWX43682.1 Glucuronate isomerase [Allomuricauda aurantiaca]